MTTIRIFALALLTLAGAVFTCAQEREGARRSDPTVTVSVSTAGLRFASPSLIGQMRVEVFGAGGDTLYNSDFRPGAVRDWDLRDGEGRAMSDGKYLCVVTLRDLSGRLSVKQGTIVVEGGRAALQLEAGADVGAVEAEQSLTKAPSTAAATLTVHDGEQGQLVSTQGALTIRLGDFFGGEDKERMRVTPEGRVGVGTDKPEAELDVAGAVRARDGFEFADGSRLKLGDNGSLVRTAPDGATLNGLSSVAAASANRLVKFTDGAGTLGDSVVTEAGGFIGVGTTAPEGTLHIQSADTTVFKMASIGAVNAGRAVFQMYRGTSNTANGWDFGYNTDLSTEGFIIRELTNGFANATRFAIQKGTGNIGIGTTNPSQKLDVSGNVNANGLCIAGDCKTAWSQVGGSGGGGVSGSGTTNTVPLWSGSTALSNSVITQTGSNISVGGNLTATGTISGGNVIAKYQDVAEWVPSRREIAAGTVVVLDTKLNNAVLPSRRAYDIHVAGVVSAQPGVILGEGGAGKVLVATTGRVKVRVDARRGAVRIGDLLVTSGREGVAMRSRPVRAGRALLHRPGTIIGKALEPLAKGEGEILVLLSLQ